MPKCEVGYVRHTIVRDSASGVVIYDSTGMRSPDERKPARAFRRPKSVEVILEVNLTNEVSAKEMTWEETELGPRAASE